MCVRPAASNIANGVATATKDKGGNTKGLDKVDAGAMTADAQIEAAQTITAQRVCAALQHNRSRPVKVHDVLDHRTEQLFVAEVVDSVLNRERGQNVRKKD